MVNTIKRNRKIHIFRDFYLDILWYVSYAEIFDVSSQSRLRPESVY